MTRFFGAIVIFLSLLPSGTNSVCGAGQESRLRLIKIEGLKPTYAACEHADFSIRNISKQELYVEVYVEKFDSSSWGDDMYPYAINDPPSLYSKMVKANRIKEGAVLLLSYDRCLKPRFVKEDEALFKQRIAEADRTAEDAGTPIAQRIRIEVRFRDPKAKVEKIWSAPFKRAAEKNSEAK
jgi:hypothetical protein